MLSIKHELNPVCTNKETAPNNKGCTYSVDVLNLIIPEQEKHNQSHRIQDLWRPV
jgi:hypothetical protein